MKTLNIKVLKQVLPVLLIFSLLSCTKNKDIPETPLPGNTTVINVSMASGGGTVAHLRGFATPGQHGFLDNAQNGVQLKQLMDIGQTEHNGLINGYRDMYQDVNYDEFKKNGASYTIRQEPSYTTMRTYAKSKGFVQVCQIAGHNTTSGFGFDPAYQLVGDAGFFPIPEPGINTTLLQNAFSDWAIQSDNNIGIKSIWIGAQEPTHTLGFFNGVKDDAGLKENISRYVSYWKPIAVRIQSGGSYAGGIQLNSANADLYDYAVQVMKDSSLQLDYLTFQLYRWGDTSDLNAAIHALNSYRQKYPTTKIIINRGNWDKIVPGGADGSTTSTGMTTFLQGEKVMVDNPGLFYGYTLDKTANNFSDQTLEYKTVQWLNQQLYPIQRVFTGLPAGVNGFVTSESTSKLSAVLWNQSDSVYNISLKITDANIPGTAAITAFKASNTNFTALPLAWNNVTSQITGISLNKYEYTLIQLK